MLQVTIQDVEIKDFANAAIHIQQSEAVAIMDTSIHADIDLEGPQGIIVDASKRVFIGKTTVKCSGHCISAINKGAFELSSWTSCRGADADFTPVFPGLRLT